MSEVEESSKEIGQVIGLDKRQLLARHLQGDENAFEELMEIYKAPVYSYLVRSGINEADRDDLFQESFIKIHLNASRYDSSRPLAPWLFTVVANTTRSYFRKQKTRNEKANIDNNDATVSSPQDHSEANELADWLQAEIDQLPIAQREVLLMSTVAKLDQRQIAVSLDMTVNNVKTCLRRARMQLAKSLARRKLAQKREAS